MNETPEISELLEDRVYFYEPSENDDTSKSFIIVDPLISYNTAKHASNSYFSREFSFQIDIETYDFEETHKLCALIIDALNEHRLYVEDGGMDEYFKETQRYVISKRFYGTPKKLNKN